MNPASLTFRDLEYILAVARYSSFSQAAIACAVSQPALSKQIKSIETTLGVVLFERTKRKVMLTEAGEAFIKQAQIVMDEGEKLLQATSVYKRAVLSGSFRLGVIASSCPYLLPHFVGELKTEYTDLKLIIKEGLTDPLINELKQGHLDAVIAATTFEDDMLSYQPLFFEPFLLVSQRGKTAYKARIDIADIDTQKLLLLEDGHCLKDQTVELCALGDQNIFNFKATSLETLLQMTAGGLGISVIPQLAMPDSEKFGSSLTYSHFKNKKIGRTMALYFRKTYPLTENIQTLTRFIKKHLPQGIREV